MGSFESYSKSLFFYRKKIYIIEWKWKIRRDLVPHRFVSNELDSSNSFLHVIKII